MAKYAIDDATLTAIADAIRAKTGVPDTMLPTEMADLIASIGSGGGGGRPFATGTHASNNLSSTDLTVSGLSFRPVLIFATSTRTNVPMAFMELDVFYDQENSLHLSHIANSYADDWGGNVLAIRSNSSYVTTTDNSFTLKRLSTYGFKYEWRWWAFGAEG